MTLYAFLIFVFAVYLCVQANFPGAGQHQLFHNSKDFEEASTRRNHQWTISRGSYSHFSYPPILLEKVPDVCKSLTNFNCSSFPLSPPHLLPQILLPAASPWRRKYCCPSTIHINLLFLSLVHHICPLLRKWTCPQTLLTVLKGWSLLWLVYVVHTFSSISGFKALT